MIKNNLINTHLHTTGSDGTLTPEQTVKLAIKLGFSYICFTDHYKTPPSINHSSCDYHSESYYKQVKDSIKKYKDKIQVCYGAEFSWSKHDIPWTKKEIKKRPYDYIIGSMHYISPDNKNFYGVNDIPVNFIKLFNKFNNIQNFVKKYYKNTRDMINSNIFDSVGHFDVIKIWNQNNKYFNQNENYYKDEIIKTLNTLEKSNMALEINTSGWRRPCNEQYPSTFALKEAYKRNIQVTIGTDVHRPNEFDLGLKKAYALAKKTGYTHILKYVNRKPIKVKL